MSFDKTTFLNLKIGGGMKHVLQNMMCKRTFTLQKSMIRFPLLKHFLTEFAIDMSLKQQICSGGSRSYPIWKKKVDKLYEK